MELLGDGAVHEVLVAQRVGEEALHGVVEHVDVGVVVQRHDAAGIHQHIFRDVHHGITVRAVGAALDSRNQHVIDVKQSMAQNKMVLYCD